MAQGFFALDYLNIMMDVMEDISDEEEVEYARITRRYFRDTLDPFRLPENQFRTNFRLSRQLASDLCDWQRPTLEKDRSHAVSVEKQVLTALRFYATGSTQESAGRHAYLSVSQPVVSRCIKDVTQAINRLLFRDCVKFPTTPQDRAAAKQKFATAPQPFEGAIGAIDCTLVAIIAPREHEDGYVNHHGYHSLNVQMVCDPSLKILQVCARFGGRVHDTFIWNASPVRASMIEHWENGDRNTWLIGDSGYPLEPWMLLPIPDAEPGTPEFRYTQYHCQARSIIERCYGVLKAVWICLSKKRVLWYGPIAAGRIVNACAVLHNLRLQYNIAAEEDYEDGLDEEAGAEQGEVEEFEEEDELGNEPVVRQGAPVGDARFRLAQETRLAYINRHFL